MNEKPAQGIGIVVNKANYISEEQKNYLWGKWFLGSENKELLCQTFVWIFGIQFALRAGQEHRKLRFNNHNHLNNMTNRVMHEFLLHNEDVSKTNSGLGYFCVKKKCC